MFKGDRKDRVENSSIPVDHLIFESQQFLFILKNIYQDSRACRSFHTTKYIKIEEFCSKKRRIGVRKIIPNGKVCRDLNILLWWHGALTRSSIIKILVML